MHPQSSQFNGRKESHHTPNRWTTSKSSRQHGIQWQKISAIMQIRAEPLLEVYVSSKLPHWVKRYFISNNFIWENRGCVSCEHGTLSSSFTNPCRKCILRAKSHASSSALNHDLKELQYSDGRFHKALQMKITKYHACTKKTKTWINQINKTIFI